MKTALQKMYEKHQMLLNSNSENPLKLMLAKHNNKWGVYVVVGNKPVAKLLTETELDETDPDFEASELLEEGLKQIESKDPRRAAPLNRIPFAQLDEYGGDGFEDLFQPLIDQLPCG